MGTEQVDDIKQQQATTAAASSEGNESKTKWIAVLQPYVECSNLLMTKLHELQKEQEHL